MRLPFWFLKERFFTYLGIMLVVLFSGYLFYKGQALAGLIVLSFSLAAFFSARDSFKRRKHGILLEEEAYRFLKEKIPYDIEFRKKLKSGGDIDIYIPDLNIAIDVKAYRKIDKRIFQDRNRRSIARQKEIAYKVIVWLPNAQENRIKNYKDFIVVCGWQPMVGFLKNYAAK